MSTTRMTSQPATPAAPSDPTSVARGREGDGPGPMMPGDSVLGRLQRGRGVVARSPRPSYADAVYDCVVTDRRQNPCLDEHGLYYARLIVDLDLPITPLVTHLNATDTTQHTSATQRTSAAQHSGATQDTGAIRDIGTAQHTSATHETAATQDTDAAHPTDLTVQVLGLLVRLGRDDACDPLIEHAENGANWYAALGEIGSWDERVLDRLDQPGQRGRHGRHIRHRRSGRFGQDERFQRLPAIAVETCDDEELRWLVEPDSRLWRQWARRYPRIAGALAERRRVAAPRVGRLPDLSDLPTADLLRRLLDQTDTERGPGRYRIREVRELARRDPQVLLDVVEELLVTGRRDRRTAVEVGLRDLGPLAVPRARRWLRHDTAYADAAIPVLAAHGTHADLPPLLADLEHKVAGRDWFGAFDRVEALGRLRVASALPLLLMVWEETEYAHLRLRVLQAIHRIRAEAARPLLAEAPWDCEHEVREYAAEHTGLDDTLVVPRLRRLRDEHAEDPAVRAAAARRLAPPTRLAR